MRVGVATTAAFSAAMLFLGGCRRGRPGGVPTWVVIPGHTVVKAAPDRPKDSYDRTVANMNLLGPARGDAQPGF